MSKSGYQIGFVKSLLKYIDVEEIKAISGSSMGLLCAYALASNKMDVFESFFRNIDIKKPGQLFHQVFFKRLIYREVRAFIDCNDEVHIPIAFPVCYIPLYNVKYYWLKGKYNPIWFRYICAAINYPFLHIFPTLLNGRFAIDGGAADNIPLFPLLKCGNQFIEDEEFDLVIVMHFDARYDYRRDFTTDVPILEVDLAISNEFKKNHYDFSSEFVDEMITKGEEYGDKIFNRLFGGDCSREHFQKVVNEIFLEEHAVRQKNLSLDRLLTILNTVGKALRKDSDCNKHLF